MQRRPQCKHRVWGARAGLGAADLRVFLGFALAWRFIYLFFWFCDYSHSGLTRVCVCVCVGMYTMAFSALVRVCAPVCVCVCGVRVCFVCVRVIAQDVKMWVKKVKKKKTHQPSRSSEGCKRGLDAEHNDMGKREKNRGDTESKKRTSQARSCNRPFFFFSLNQKNRNSN